MCGYIDANICLSCHNNNHLGAKLLTIVLVTYEILVVNVIGVI